MFKLIRDKIPELAKKDGQVINYASVQNDELFIGLLRNKLVEEVQEFLNTGEVTELVDVETVIKALIKVSGLSDEDFTKLYNEKLKTNGDFDKRYVGFFPDPTPSQGSAE